MIRNVCACLAMLLALVTPGSAAPAAPAEPPPVVGTNPVTPDGDWSQAPEYRLVPGDALVLNFGLSDVAASGFLERPMIVRPDGRISVFPIGDVVAAGRTPRELEATLIDLLSASLKQPRVTVEVGKIAGNQVHVLGRVEKPGSYPAEPFVTLSMAITAAGGFKDDAARNSVVVFHRVGAREVGVTLVALDRMLKRGSLAAEMPLSRFDIVYVPRSTIGNVGVFTEQVFGPLSTVFSTSLLGWELFHLDRVFTSIPFH